MSERRIIVVVGVYGAEVAIQEAESGGGLGCYGTTKPAVLL